MFSLYLSPLFCFVASALLVWFSLKLEWNTRNIHETCLDGGKKGFFLNLDKSVTFIKQLNQRARCRSAIKDVLFAAACVLFSKASFIPVQNTETVCASRRMSRWRCAEPSLDKKNRTQQHRAKRKNNNIELIVDSWRMFIYAVNYCIMKIIMMIIINNTL